MPELLMSRKMCGEENEAGILEGIHAFQKILLNWLDFNEPILSYGIPNTAPELMENFIPHFHDVRIKKQISMFAIHE